MAIDPTPEQLTALAQGEDDGPLVMLNLNRYRERAAYGEAPPNGEDPDVSGREAYERYGAVALRVLERVGGEVVWHATAREAVVGDERYDEVIAVRYPSPMAFLALAFDGELGEALPHRTAGLEQARLLRCDAP